MGVKILNDEGRWIDDNNVIDILSSIKTLSTIS